MATLRRLEEAYVDDNGISKAKSHVFRRGNSRRYVSAMRKNPKLQIPETRDITEVADYEIQCTWVTKIYPATPIGEMYWNGAGLLPGPSPSWDPAEWYMMFLGAGEGTGRPAGSKILIGPNADEAYALLTWTDLFGHPIQERQLGLGNSDGWTVYAKKLTNVELSEVHEALINAGIEV